MKRLFMFLLIICLTGCNTGLDVDPPMDTVSMVTETHTGRETTYTQETTQADVATGPIKGATTHFVVFSNIFVGKQEDNINQVISELNVLSRAMLNITADFVFINANQKYSDVLNTMIESGEVPDIFLAKGLYGSKYQKDNLFDLAQSDTIADLTDLIYGLSPYMNAFYQSYPAFKDFSMIDGRIYGIIMPEVFLPRMPAFSIKKDLCEQYNIDSVTTFYEALDVCKFLSSKIEQEEKNIYVENRICTQAIIDHEGYYNAFSRFPFVYLLEKEDDSLTLHRSDKTNILDAITNMKQDFEQYNIQTYDEYAELDDINAILTDTAPPLSLKEYNVFYLVNNPSYYPNGMQLEIFDYFVVSNNCLEKEKAVTYIDWFFGEPQARKLVGYGIQDVNYIFDDQTNILSFTDSPISLFHIGTGESFAQPHDVFIDDKNEINYIKNIQYRNYELNALNKKVLQNLSKIEAMHEKDNEVIRKYRDQNNYEMIGLLEDLFAKVQGSYRISHYMSPNVTIEIVEKTKELLRESYNQEFVDALQDVLWELN